MMLYELAYPALYLGAKTHQTVRRTRALIGLGPRDMARITYDPASFYRVACWRLRKMDIELMMRVSPTRAARLSVERFEGTRRMALRNNAAEGAQKTVTRWRGRHVEMLHFGPAEGPRVLALHGWNGRATMLRKMAEALGAQGYHVVVPDLPGHGESEGDRFSFYDLGRATAELYQGEAFEAVIGHSAGGLIAAIALGAGLRAKSYIPIGTPLSLYALLHAHVEITQMPLAAMPHIERYYTRRYGMSPVSVGPELISTLPVRTLVIHEKSDWQVKEENARSIAAAAKDSELLITTGLTHLGVLTSPLVHAAITRFLGGGAHA
jgi:pimeloyl-ACP methyl ester carboxylesterase